MRLRIHLSPSALRCSLAFALFLAAGPMLCQQGSVPSDVLERKVEAALHRLTLEQKIDLIGGVSTWYTHAEPGIGLRSMRLSDGPAGLRSGLPATAYPAPVALAASWDTALARTMGEALGRDARVRGVDLLLGPGVNIARAPMNGRNFEYMGEDPWLTSRIAVAYIQGVESQGVGATVKHFMMNNQEFNRHNASSDADERTKREIYLPAFEAAIKEAHVAAVMDSYNLVDGVHSTQNGWMNLQVVKKEWGFDGIIVSDWNSVYDGVAAAQNGLDLEMPFAHFFSRETLLPAVRGGAVPEATIDDKVRRILRFSYRYDLDHRTRDDSDSLFSEESDKVALDVARESIVLLKNEHALLPLDLNKTCTLAIIGPNASPAVMNGGGSAVVDSYKSVSILEGVSDFVAANSSPAPTCQHRVLYDSGWPANYDVFAHANFRGGLRQQVFASRDWSGTSEDSTRDHLNEDRIVTPAKGSLRWTGRFVAEKPGQYYIIVHDGRTADRHAVFVDGQPLATRPTDLHGELYYLPVPRKLRTGETVELRFDYLPANTEVYPGLGVLHEDDVLSDRARSLAKTADAVVIAAGFDKTTEHEGMDRTFDLPPLQDTLILNIAALNPRSIVTLNAGGNLNMNAWYGRVPALLHLWYPGQEGGKALAEILFGRRNPEGHLPVSFEAQWADNPTVHSYYPQGDPNEKTPHIRYTEGIFLGYRYYQTPQVNTARVQPRFPFGYGLSYTSFRFSDLTLSRDSARAGEALTATVTVTNTGAVAGAAVAQMYVGADAPAVPRPAYELKCFAKVSLRPGESRTVTLPLDPRAFAYWSERTHDWQVDPGRYTVYVGDSSASLPLRRTLVLR